MPSFTEGDFEPMLLITVATTAFPRSLPALHPLGAEQHHGVAVDESSVRVDEDRASPSPSKATPRSQPDRRPAAPAIGWVDRIRG